MPSFNRPPYRAIATLTIAAALAGCSGGGSSSSVIPSAQSPSSALVAAGGASAAAHAAPGAGPLTAIPQPAGTNAPMLSAKSLQFSSALSVTSGATLASSDFSKDAIGSVPQGFTVMGGTATVCASPSGGNQLCLGGGNGSMVVAGDPAWTNYHTDVTVTSADLTRGGVTLLGRVLDAQHYYEYELRPDVNGTGKLFWYIWRFDGNWNLLASGSLASAPAAPFAIRFDMQGTNLSAWLGQSTATLAPLGGASDSGIAHGMAGIRSWGSPATFGPVAAVADVGAGTPIASPTATPAPIPTPTPVPLPTEAPRSAGAFVAGTGVNMHNAFYGTGYTNNTSAVVGLVSNLGVKVVRDGIALGQNNVCAEDQAIAGHGIKFDVIVDVTATASDLAQWSSCMGGGTIASFEGANEYDISHPGSDTNWVSTLQTAQQALYPNAKTVGGMPVIGPAITSGGAAGALGDLSGYMDYGNAHIYYSDYNPETGGYGSGGYGSIAYSLGYVSNVSGSKPVVVTETGYGTDAGQLSETTQAKYIVRNYLSLANAGVKGIYNYELIDEGGAPFAKMGLVRSDLSPKPSYYALQGLLSVLADGSSGSALTPLGYTLTGSTANLQHSLFQKSDGTYVLALWLGVQSCDPNSGADQAIAAQNVTLTLQRSVAPTVTSFTTGGRMQQQVLANSPTSTIAVTDQVKLISFK